MLKAFILFHVACYVIGVATAVHRATSDPYEVKRTSAARHAVLCAAVLMWALYVFRTLP